MENIDEVPAPSGKLVTQTVAMHKDINSNGDIFGGWLLGQMDHAGGIFSARIAKGRVVTVGISEMSFLLPVPVGAVVSCYVETLSIGTTSIRVLVEVWITSAISEEQRKVTEGEFVFVAIDEEGKTRAVLKED